MTNEPKPITQKNVNGAIVFSDDHGGQVAAVIRDVFGADGGIVGYHPSIIGMVLREVNPSNPDERAAGGLAIQLGTKADTYASRGNEAQVRITRPKDSWIHDFKVSDLLCQKGDDNIAEKSIHGDVGVAIAATRIKEFSQKHPELVAEVRKALPLPITIFGGSQMSLDEMLSASPIGRDACTEPLLKEGRAVNAKGGK